MAKLGRKYRLTIESNTGDEALVIEPPLTIDFNVSRSAMASLNSMQVSIYNLKQDTRNKIFQDWYNPKDYKKIILQAGYDNLSLCFTGNIFQAFSYRQGADVITFIDARDGGFDVANNKTQETLSADTSIDDLLTRLTSKFDYVKKGKFGTISGAVRRPVVLDGNTFGLIKKYSNGLAYIDLEELHIINNNEVVEADVLLINSETGLIGTPRRENALLTIETIFEPRIIMSQILEIESDIEPQYNGQYKVIGLQHSGMISEAVSGNCRSKFNLLVGSKLFGEFKTI